MNYEVGNVIEVNCTTFKGTQSDPQTSITLGPDGILGNRAYAAYLLEKIEKGKFPYATARVLGLEPMIGWKSGEDPQTGRSWLQMGQSESPIEIQRNEVLIAACLTQMCGQEVLVKEGYPDRRGTVSVISTASLGLLAQATGLTSLSMSDLNKSTRADIILDATDSEAQWPVGKYTSLAFFKKGLGMASAVLKLDGMIIRCTIPGFVNGTTQRNEGIIDYIRKNLGNRLARHTTVCQEGDISTGMTAYLSDEF